ncbi:uncharacterized protein RBU57_003085 isoform 2-T12 [Macrochelys suwanniensis]
MGKCHGEYLYLYRICSDNLLCFSRRTLVFLLSAGQLRRSSGCWDECQMVGRNLSVFITTTTKTGENRWKKLLILLDYLQQQQEELLLEPDITKGLLLTCRSQ